MRKRILARTRVVRVLRNSAIIAIASFASVQVASAVSPNVANTLSRLTGMKLFVNPDSPARRQANEWRRSRPSDAAKLERIASQPVALWLGDGNRTVRADVAGIMSRAAQQGATPIFVAYNIPSRDCGSYSAGGSSSSNAYRKWIREFAAGLGGKSSVVILEPDAVPGADCLSAAARDERFGLLRDAVQVLKNARAVVYIDAGHARWMKPDVAAERLEKAGIALADGFSLNVSNYLSTSVNVSYGDQVSRRVGGKHYIVDTSRNGQGGKGGEWCNVSGQSLGSAPTTNTGHPLADAFLWVKQPGESDGTCGGGPRAGQWWAQYALGLAERQADSD
jgi:endoglucanase